MRRLINTTGGMLRIAFWLCLAFMLTTCGKHLPNPVQSHDGVSYIPLDDTAFLIPEKTWLKGYGRRSTDGMVDSIALHATIPDVQPWSKERNDEMYGTAPGKKLEITIKGDRAGRGMRFQNLFQEFEFIEEPSDQAAQGLRRFRKAAVFDPTPDELERYRKSKKGDPPVEFSRAKPGTKDLMDVFYMLIEDGRIKYSIRCDDADHTGALFKGCHLMFPLTHSTIVEIYFIRDYIQNIVAMADRVNAQIHEFQTAGLAYKATLSTTQPPHQ